MTELQRRGDNRPQQQPQRWQGCETTVTTKTSTTMAIPTATTTPTATVTDDDRNSNNIRDDDNNCNRSSTMTKESDTVFVVAGRTFVTIVVTGLVSSLLPVLVSSASLVSSVVAIVLAAVIAAIVVGGGVLHAVLVVVGSCAPCLSGHDGDCRRRVGVVAGLLLSCAAAGVGAKGWKRRGTFNEMMVNGDDFAHTFDEFVTKDQTPSKGEKAVEVKDADADENIKKRQTTKRAQTVTQDEAQEHLDSDAIACRKGNDNGTTRRVLRRSWRIDETSNLDFNCLLQQWKNSRYRGEVSLAYVRMWIQKKKLKSRSFVDWSERGKLVLHCIALTSLFPLRHTAFISHMALAAPTLSPHQECIKTAVSTLPFLMSEPHKKASKRGGEYNQCVPAVRVYKTPLIFGLLEYCRFRHIFHDVLTLTAPYAADLAHPPSSTSPKPPINDYDTATAGCAPKQAMTAGTSTSQLQPQGPPCDNHYLNRHLNHDHHVTTACHHPTCTLNHTIAAVNHHTPITKTVTQPWGCAPTQVEETTTTVTTTTERRQQRDDDEHWWCSGAAK
ncbi:hypothetical protein EDB85DRAFT_2273050 [Lactarius pseudohatsudake]|nr:hypothetical protein EDB85DRAFT_2273050 [Lactarius pseudohatsudake]